MIIKMKTKGTVSRYSQFKSFMHYRKSFCFTQGDVENGKKGRLKEGSKRVTY